MPHWSVTPWGRCSSRVRRRTYHGLQFRAAAHEACSRPCRAYDGRRIGCLLRVACTREPDRRMGVAPEPGDRPTRGARTPRRGVRTKVRRARRSAPTTLGRMAPDAGVHRVLEEHAEPVARQAPISARGGRVEGGDALSVKRDCGIAIARITACGSRFQRGARGQFAGSGFKQVEGRLRGLGGLPGYCFPGEHSVNAAMSGSVPKQVGLEQRDLHSCEV